MKRLLRFIAIVFLLAILGGCIYLNGRLYSCQDARRKMWRRST